MQLNPENAVGVLTMAGKGVRVLVTPTSDLGKVLACMHVLDAGLEMAALPKQKQLQRIIHFAGSPIKHEKKVLEMIGSSRRECTPVFSGNGDGGNGFAAAAAAVPACRCLWIDPNDPSVKDVAASMQNQSEPQGIKGRRRENFLQLLFHDRWNLVLAVYAHSCKHSAENVNEGFRLC
ncbi:26S proteasome non-ATPase regulatory subunit 4 [Melia azedarach]|uniref:26S proteasome non-ATPase regulatory subunit 4 n=1 Tax=Melia azedarach TaxID=155640 RepID=A0ACC1XRP9_MELAZ|nr:26S proteasome non-ATPase regulatory subunit 4 [Melia azedarach]